MTATASIKKNLTLTVPLLAALIAVALSAPHGAAAFGKNKVQYQYMEWRYLRAPHYTLYYHQDQGALPEPAYAWLDEAYRDLSSRFRFRHAAPVPVVLYGSPALFEQTNIITELLPEEVGGFTEMFKNRVAVPHNGSLSDLRHVLRHELVHAFVFGMVYGGGIMGAAGAQVPLWFNEGLAEALSTGWDRGADMYMLDRMLYSSVPPPGPALDGYLAYKGGQSFLYYLYCIGGEGAFNRMLVEFKNTRSAEAAIEKVYRAKLEDLGKDWQNELRRIYWPEAGRRALPDATASPVAARERSRMNVYPRVSPDGKRIAFFSDRHDYTRIIVADTSGKELRSIGGEHSLGGSFESFRPMSGALAWSPGGRQIAFIAKKGGRDEIRVVSAATGKRLRSIRPPLSAIGGLDWSKDGKRLVFAGLSDGQTALYTLDLATDGMERHAGARGSIESPRFSPDGRRVIFAATADTAGPWPGPFSGARGPKPNIAICDIGGGCRLLTDTEWSDRQPAFSPDGSLFAFVSDRNGIDNLYVDSVDAPGNPRPLTDYTGKCANPDWAADGSAIVFDLFMNQSWNIRRMAKPLEKVLGDTVLAPTKWAEHEADTAIPFFKGAAKGGATVRIDSAKSGNTGNPGVSGGGANARGGWPWRRGRNPADTIKDPFAVDPPFDSIPQPERYKLRFTPDFVIFGLGVNTYSGASGQALASFSDIMGDHRVTLVGDLQIDLADYAQIFASYEYLKLRVNMMAGGFYNKYYSYDWLSGQIYHDLETGGILGLSYPFSVFSRADLEFFGRYIRRDPLAGDTAAAATESNAFLTTLGYSFDNILWGITGPLAGLRASVSAQLAPPLPVTGEAYVSGDIDLRHYTHILGRYVWANRLLLGASAPLGGDSATAARKYFLGGNDNWFNYDVNIDNYSKNLNYSYYSSIVSPLRGWNYFDIAGDRVFLANSEFRFPFIREVSTVWPIPMQIRYINGALFFDAGYAWTGSGGDAEGGNNILPPKIAGGYGFGMRANLGIFVLRYDRGWATDFRGGGGTPINYFSLGAEF